jgi:Holliday junction DNA helicase RuvB
MKEKLPLHEFQKEFPQESQEGATSESYSENKLRPQKLDDYIGQKAVTSRLEVFLAAAKKRKSSLDHVLLSGPPGLGKTTLAYIIARELGGQLHQVPGPSIERSVDLLAILSSLQAGDVLFIDEIHRLNATIEESLYPAMEDRRIQVVLGEGSAAQAVTLPLQPFTLVGATTQAGKLTAPLRDRFGIHFNLDFYSEEEMCEILTRSASILQIKLDNDELIKVAKRSRGTPRVGNRLLSRVRDFVEVSREKKSDLSQQTREVVQKFSQKKETALVDAALDFLDVDLQGLQPLDRRYLQILIDNFNGGPAGIEALAASLSEDRRTLEELVEPYLLKIGYLIRSSRGRIATPQAYTHLGLKIPAKIASIDTSQETLI